MTTDVTKKPESEIDLDGFDGFTDESEGTDDRSLGSRVIQGEPIKFTNEAAWVDSSGQELPARLELIMVDIGRIVQKWKDQQPVETIILAPHQKYPDVRAMNEACPKSEWREWNGQLLGPWQAQHVAYLLNPADMNKFSWPTGTVGGNIAIAEIAEKTRNMRRFRGQRVYAVVRLTDKFMPTRWGGRQRPHLEVVRWVTLDGTGALPAPDTPAIAGPSAPSPPSATEAIGLKTVSEPSRKEELGDEIPF
jgi:hypothetical protein